MMAWVVKFTPLTDGLLPLTFLTDSETVVGRSPETGIQDTNVSRQHLTVKVDCDELGLPLVFLKQSGVNPCVVIPADGTTRIIEKGSSTEVHKGDTVHLLPNHSVSYRVQILKNDTESVAGVNKVPKPQDLSVSHSKATDAVPTLRPIRVENYSSFRFEKVARETTPPGDVLSVSREGYWAADIVPPSKKVKPESSLDDIHPEFYSDPRPICPSGRGCSNKVEEHLLTYKHPNLSSVELERAAVEELSDDDPLPDLVLPEDHLRFPDAPSDHDDHFDDTNLPPCPYGSSCYRTNVVHIRSYCHKEKREIGKGKDTGKTPICPHGPSCYRVNPQHFIQFDHPWKRDSSSGIPIPSTEAREPDIDEGPVAAIVVGDLPLGAAGTKATRAKAKTASDIPKGAPPPLNWLDDGDMYSFSGGAGKYHIKNAAGIYYCTCVAWRYQLKGPDERNCKHLEEFLGSRYNKWRIDQCSGGGGGGALSDDAPATTPGSAVLTTGAKKSMTPALLLANKYEDKMNPSGWWISEKLDGVRAYWDGTQFVSRLGNVYTAPEYFRKGLPSTPLDGELFGGRKKFQFTVGIVKSSSKTEFWKQLTYQVFDAPSLTKPFEERLAWLQHTLPATPFIKIVEHYKCKGKDHLASELLKIEKLGGEGLMLRQAGSPYVPSRSSTLLKVKSFKEFDAKVIGHEAGKGKYSGMTGALTCQLPNGKKFCCGSGMTDADRSRPPPVGSIIAFRYQELTDGGIPRFPRFLGVKADGKWPPDDPWPPSGGGED